MTDPRLTQARQTQEELLAFRRGVLARTRGDGDFKKAAWPLLVLLDARVGKGREDILALEKEIGCVHCGAQQNEDCRIDRGGDCLFAEDARELALNRD